MLTAVSDEPRAADAVARLYERVGFP